MRREDFVIGQVFWAGGRAWVCTDVGTRVIVAQVVGQPRVGAAELVFDENDFPGCRATADEWKRDFE